MLDQTEEKLMLSWLTDAVRDQNLWILRLLPERTRLSETRHSLPPRSSWPKEITMTILSGYLLKFSLKITLSVKSFFNFVSCVFSFWQMTYNQNTRVGRWRESLNLLLHTQETLPFTLSSARFLNILLQFETFWCHRKGFNSENENRQIFMGVTVSPNTHTSLWD